jgi:hypothetical protein
MERDVMYVDADPATNLPAYSGDELRFAQQALQAGVFFANDFKVTATAGLSVDVAGGRGIAVPVFGGTQAGTRYGIYNDAVVNSDNFEAGGIPANASANPRLDAVVARVWDHTQDGSGQRKWRLVYIAGSPSAGAALGGTLPSLPTGSLILAEVLTPGSNPTSIPATNIRDRRGWARGAYTQVIRTSDGGGGSDYPFTSATPTVLDAFNVQRRVECSGAALEIILRGVAQHSIVDFELIVSLRMDGAPLSGGQAHYITPSGPATRWAGFNIAWDIIPPAGSHLFAPYVSNSGGAGTATIKAAAGVPLEFVIREFGGRLVADNS